MGFGPFFFVNKMLNRRADKLELLRIAEAVALEKSIDKELIIDSMESGIAKAAKSKFGSENEITVQINRDNGDIGIYRKLKIVEKPMNLNLEIGLTEAISINKENEEKKIGDEILQPLPSFDFGRIAAQTAKQVITFSVREAERQRQYNDFKDKKDTILSGIVKRLEFGNVIVDLGGTEAIIQKSEMIPRENIKAGDRVKAYCLDVRREQRGQQIFLSRANHKFMEKLFIQEVPEIYDGLIEIKSSSRDPGSRAKICVKAIDTSLDPVGACVGMRGSRVQAVVNELQGEKIDIIPWNDDAPTFLVNALQPAEVSKVVLDEDAKRIEVVVPTDQLSLAIGRRGQNVRLASQLTEYDIDILTEEDESQRRQEEFSERSQLFMEHLNVDEMVAQLLVSEGFSTMEEVAFVESSEISSIDGFDKETATELQERAKDYLENLNKKSLDFAKSNGIEDDLLNFEGLNPQMLEVLVKDGIKSLQDFATCADWELAGGYTVVDGKRVRDEGLLEHFELSLSEAQQLIMKAREMLGWVTKEESEEIIKSLDK